VAWLPNNTQFIIIVVLYSLDASRRSDPISASRLDKIAHYTNSRWGQTAMDRYLLVDLVDEFPNECCISRSMLITMVIKWWKRFLKEISSNNNIYNKRKPLPT
jgi:hypothetical protein